MSLKSAADAPTYHANYAEILFELARDLGADGRLLLRGTGISEPVLRHPEGMFSVTQFKALVRNALALTGQPGLGLLYGHSLTFTSHGALGQAALSGETLRQAIDLMVRYYRIRFLQIDLQFFVEGDRAVIQMTDLMDLGDLEPFLIEALFVTIMDINVLLFGDKLIRTGTARFRYPEPAWSADYRPIFHDAMQFSAEHNQLRFDAALLDLPLAPANPIARRRAEAQCEEALQRLQQEKTVLAKVRRLLETATSLPDMEAVAAQLHMSSRTLRRQLEGHGVNYQDLIADVRHTRAIQLLGSTPLSIDDVASQLGYRDPSNFGRAFRKWTGQSPTEWRRQQTGL